MRLTTLVFIFASILILFAVCPRHLGEPNLVTPDIQLVLAADLPSLSAALDAGADPQGSPDTLYPPLSHCVLHNLDAGIELLIARGANPDGHATHHPLILAVTRNNLNATRILLRLGANPNLTNSHGQAPLHLLATRPDLDPDLIRILLAAGADPQQPNFQGHTSLSLACSSNNPAAIALLLAAGSTPSPINHPTRSQVLSQ